MKRKMQKFLQGLQNFETMCKISQKHYSSAYGETGRKDKTVTVFSKKKILLLLFNLIYLLKKNFLS